MVMIDAIGVVVCLMTVAVIFVEITVGYSLTIFHWAIDGKAIQQKTQ
jgi:hypothetical protein